MKAEPVANGVYRILKGYVKAYLIEADDGLVLVDSGLPKRAGKITGIIAQMGSSASRIRHILITHHHSDHVGSWPRWPGSPAPPCTSTPPTRRS
jgi:glyoxylase-like metal-dependent hydrolase (beta-lactamase superfamily II)